MSVKRAFRHSLVVASAKLAGSKGNRRKRIKAGEELFSFLSDTHQTVPDIKEVTKEMLVAFLAHLANPLAPRVNKSATRGNAPDFCRHFCASMRTCGHFF